jgi:hypothetical protein
MPSGGVGGFREQHAVAKLEHCQRHNFAMRDFAGSGDFGRGSQRRPAAINQEIDSCHVR